MAYEHLLTEIEAIEADIHTLRVDVFAHLGLVKNKKVSKNELHKQVCYLSEDILIRLNDLKIEAINKKSSSPDRPE